MPPFKMDLPPPREEERFEDLCRDIWSRIWDDRDARKHGRRGQKQYGVDVFGKGLDGWEGVQCKRKGRGKRLTEKEILGEIQEADEFPLGPLKKLTIATTACRDAETQAVARKLSDAHEKEGRFPVVVSGWDDILEDLDRHDDLIREYYPAYKTGALWNVPSHNVYFTGREDVLAELSRRFADDGHIGLGQAIIGLGGIGKTQMAIEYCHRHRNEYAAVFWIRAETVSAIRSGFVEVAELLDLPQVHDPAARGDDVLRAVRHWLAKNDRWLLVFDNADRPADLKPFLPDGRGRFLLTSRDSTDFAGVGIRAPILLQKHQPKEAQDLLLARIDRQASAKEREAVAELARELDCLALALEQAGAYVAARQTNYVKYLERFRKEHLMLLAKEGPKTGNYDKTVATTWKINFDMVERDSLAAADLLRALALCTPDDVPLEIFENGATNLGPHLAKALANDNIDDVLAPLQRYSLVWRDPVKWTVSIHRMVQAVVRSWLGEAEREWRQRVVKALSVAWPEPPDYETWGTCERLYPQRVVAERFVAEVEDAEARRVLRLSNVYERCRWFHETLERRTQTFATAKADLLQWIRDGGDREEAVAALKDLEAKIEAGKARSASEATIMTKKDDSDPDVNKPRSPLAEIILELEQQKELMQKLDRRRQEERRRRHRER